MHLPVLFTILPMNYLAFCRVLLALRFLEMQVFVDGRQRQPHPT